MKMPSIHIVSALLTMALFLAGCAGSDAAKEAANSTAELLKTYEAQANRTLNTQTTVEALSRSQTQRHAENTAERMAQLETILDGWRVVNDKEALAAYAALTDDNAADLIAKSATLKAAGAMKAAKSAKATIDSEAAVAALLEVGKYGSFKDRMTFLYKAMKMTADTIDAQKKPKKPTTPTE